MVVLLLSTAGFEAMVKSKCGTNISLGWRHLGSLLALVSFLSGCHAASMWSPCPEMCGNISIPYPFGITSGCGLPQFQLHCWETFRDSPHLPFDGSGESGPSFPFLASRSGPFQVFTITATSLVVNVTGFKATCGIWPHTGQDSASFLLDDNSSYALSANNKFFLDGCNSTGNVTTDLSNSVSTCVNSQPPTTPFCNTRDCCISDLPAGARQVVVHGGGSASTTGGRGFASILYPPSFAAGQFGLQLSYALTGATCSHPNVTSICAGNATCVDVNEVPGYVCQCPDDGGYVGDGYRDGSGCADLNECALPSSNKCAADAECINTLGSYSCVCVSGYRGDGFTNGTGCVLRLKKMVDGKFAIAATLLVLAILSALAFFVCWYCNRRKLKRDKESVLHTARVRISELENWQVEDAQLLTLRQLEKATSSFSEDNKMGSRGEEYKGVLEQGTVVTIKSSKSICADMEQFYNQLTLLSQVNHPHLVRLIGCCMETQVPMLVCEHVSNGNLHEYLQRERGDKPLDWNTRLRIAIESAQALAYLHSTVSVPIHHNDVKSANILLDEHFTAKVANFGFPKPLLHPGDDTRVSANSPGGYLDPQCSCHNSQTADKSDDVYSFGVILLEIIAGQNLTDLSTAPGRTTVMAALSDSFVSRAPAREIIDPYLDVERKPELMHSVAQVTNLALACLEFHRVRRPSMNQVANTLLQIKATAQSRDGETTQLLSSPFSPVASSLLSQAPDKSSCAQPASHSGMLS